MNLTCLLSVGALTVTACFGAAVSAASAQAPGTLDTSFSRDGRAAGSFGGADAVRALVVQPDGRLLLGGTDGSGRFALMRLLETGALDTSFSGDGKATTAFAGPVGVGALWVRPDGKILAAGTSTDARTFADSRLALARYLSNGALEWRREWHGEDYNEDQVLRVGFEWDGDLVSAGATHDGAGRWSGRLERFNQYGGLEAVAYTDCFCSWGGFWAFASYPDGRVVVDGERLLTRYLENFKLDPSFGADGAAAPLEATQELLVQPDGKLIAVGAADGNALLERRLVDGRLDPSFGAAGKVRLNLGGVDALRDVAIQPNGRIVAAGTSDGALVIVRLLADGRVDGSFATAGVLRVPLSGAVEPASVRTALQGDGKVVVASTAGSADGGDLSAIRAWGDPTPKCKGKAPTIASGEAVLVGSAKADVILGSNGPDRVYGDKGNDLICSSRGADHVYGERGADTILAGLDADFVEGGQDRDLIYAEGGDDLLFGNLGNDHLDGGDGFDRADGGDGADTGTANEQQLNIP